MNIDFNFIGCACFTLEIDGKLKIGCDPALAPKGTDYSSGNFQSIKQKDPVYSKKTFKNIDLWVLTHAHFDHLDEKGVSVIEKGANVISSEKCRELLEERDDLKISFIDWYEVQKISIDKYCVEIAAVPALHGGNAIIRKAMGKVNGYILKISNDIETKTIYITGDTVYRRKVIKLPREHGIDILIAFTGAAKVGMPGDPITLDIPSLNKMIKCLKPKKTVAVHIDDFTHFSISREQLKGIAYLAENGKRMEL